MITYQNKFNNLTLFESIKDIFKWALLSTGQSDKIDHKIVDAKIDVYLKALRRQVSQALDSCSIYRNDLCE